MAIILDGKTLSKNLTEKLKEEVKLLKKQLAFTPKLATILVGNDKASEIYVSMKRRACKGIGLDSVLIKLPGTTTTKQLLDEIEKLNKDKKVSGILLQHPVPKQIDEQLCFNKIKESKDVDGVNTNNFGKLAMNLKSFKSATPLGIMMLLEHYNINLEGKHAVIVGRSQILGKPIASLMLNSNATVTITHSKTKNLPDILKTADLIVACVGSPHFIKTKWLKPGAIVIDAGYNEGSIGDVEQKNLANIASYYTPVPGGVGPMTIYALLYQTVQAIKP
jgi:methylenetetrahydrofolate dehydrogenase (NADP+)/methenyltetrahydrofolate cyclohydrolase